jgi:catechol 2,3-dioxygenase-like lactoylglutathione lyase family enzyme
MSLINITGLNVIAVYVTDLDTSVEFYTSMLGFVQSKIKMPPGILLETKDTMLYIEAGRSKKNKFGEKSEFSPCFSTESIKDSYIMCVDSNIQIITDYIEYAPIFALFRIADPDGNVIEFAGKP